MSLKPRTPSEALRNAKCAEKAVEVLATYAFEYAQNGQAVWVTKPDGTPHFIDLKYKRCSCKDFAKHNDVCKHVIAVVEWDVRNAEAAQVAEYEARMQAAECSSGVDYLY